MHAQPTPKHMKCLASAVMIMTFVAIFTAPMAFAKLTTGMETQTIDPFAILTDNGRHIIATGRITCTEHERAHLRVTVTQRGTGAVAEGRALITCTGNIQQWEVQASTHGNQTFQEGPATAVALARTTDRGDTTDAHQWLVAITLGSE